MEPSPEDFEGITWEEGLALIEEFYEDVSNSSRPLENYVSPTESRGAPEESDDPLTRDHSSPKGLPATLPAGEKIDKCDTPALSPVQSQGPSDLSPIHFSTDPPSNSPPSFDSGKSSMLREVQEEEDRGHQLLSLFTEEIASSPQHRSKPHPPASNHKDQAAQNSNTRTQNGISQISTVSHEPDQYTMIGARSHSPEKIQQYGDHSYDSVQPPQDDEEVGEPPSKKLRIDTSQVQMQTFLDSAQEQHENTLIDPPSEMDVLNTTDSSSLTSLGESGPPAPEETTEQPEFASKDRHTEVPAGGNISSKKRSAATDEAGTAKRRRKFGRGPGEREMRGLVSDMPASTKRNQTRKQKREEEAARPNASGAAKARHLRKSA